MKFVLISGQTMDEENFGIKSRYWLHTLHCFLIYWQGQQECIPVGCVTPACWPYPCMHCAAGCVSLDALGRACVCSGQGVCLPRGFLPRGCLPKGCLAGGCLAGGCLPRRSVCPGWVCIPVCNGADTPSPVDRQTPVKHNFRKLNFRAVKIDDMKCAEWFFQP